MVVRPGVCVFIPAYNAASTLPGVLERIPREVWQASRAVVILDDGSRDDTPHVAADLCRRYPGLRVESADGNQGYGRTVRRGLEIGLECGADYVACLHADGQYPPERIPEFVAHMHRHGIDVLQGSRHRDGTARAGGMPLYKVVAGRWLTRLENRAFDLALTDYHSGFLVYSRRALAAVPFQRLSSYFDFDLEFIACARSLGLTVDELGIPTRYADEESHLNPVLYGLRVLGVVGRYRLGRYDPARLGRGEAR